MQSVLFSGDALLQLIADDGIEAGGARARITRTRHADDAAVGKLQLALLDWRADVLPVHGADGVYGDETAAAVKTFKIDEIGSDPATVIDDVGPLTVQHLDAIRAAAEPARASFTRREVWGLETPDAFDPMTLAYANAVTVMQARPATDPTSWSFQAAIHGSYAPPPPGARWNQCQHRGWFFLPWHRMYLFFFENIVRRIVIDAGGPADFAIPYWNYDQGAPKNQLPPAFRIPDLPDGAGPNPLFLAAPSRSRGMVAGGGLSRLLTTSAQALRMRNFSAPAGPGHASFGGGRVGPAHFAGSLGNLETTPHNGIHPAIGGEAVGECAGGLMTDPNCAALDPIFWLHHGNIDRLWNRWLTLGDGRANPDDAGWLGTGFTFFDATGAEVSLTVAEVLDSAAQLGYDYDDVPAFAPPALVPITTPPSPMQLVAASDTPLALGTDATSLPLSVPQDLVGVVAGAVQDVDQQLTVTLEDLAADADPGIVYAVFLNLPDGTTDEDERLRHHIGNVSFFGIGALNDPDEPHDGAPGLRHTFDVTDLASELSSEGAFDPSAVAITFEPLTPVPAPGEEGIALDALPTPVSIGRVSLFAG